MFFLAIMMKFLKVYYINIIWNVELNWFLLRENEYYNYKKYVYKSRIIKYFQC